MSSNAPGAIQVEKVLDDLIHRLVNGDGGAESRAALIEARRLRNVAMRWGAIPPQPDARREMLARVMELIDTVNQTSDRSSGERNMLVSPGSFTSLPPPAGSRSSAKPLKAPVAPSPPTPPPPAPSSRARAPLARRPTPPAAVAPEPAPAHGSSDEFEPLPDLGAPRVPAFESPPASDPPVARPATAAAPSAPPPSSRPSAPPRPLTLRPPSAPHEPFERSLSSPPTTTKRVPIKAVPSARGEGLEGLSTTISSSQRKAVRDDEVETVSLASAPSASPSLRKPPPPLPKRPPSTAVMPATPDRPPPSSVPRPPVASTQRPPATGSDVTVTLVPGLVLVRAVSAEWQPHPVWVGTSMKLLYHNPDNGGEYTALVKLGEGAVLPQRRHVKAEEMWMIGGSAQVGDHTVRVGEYTRAEAGSLHPKISSSAGCVFLLKGFDDDEILESTPPAADFTGGR